MGLYSHQKMYNFIISIFTALIFFLKVFKKKQKIYLPDIGKNAHVYNFE